MVVCWWLKRLVFLSKNSILVVFSAYVFGVFLGCLWVDLGQNDDRLMV